MTPSVSVITEFDCNSLQGRQSALKIVEEAILIDTNSAQESDKP